MKELIIKVGTLDEFFARGREQARILGAGGVLPEQSMHIFEDPEEMADLLTAPRRTVIQAVQDQPGSVAALAERLGRNAEDVKRDVDKLLQAGLLKVHRRAMPGGGVLKEVRTKARRVTICM